MSAVKLTAERRWCLNWWGQGGWTIGRPMSRGIKKWEKHIEMLVKAGLLEGENNGGVGSTIYRITDAGRAALAQEQTK